MTTESNTNASVAGEVPAALPPEIDEFLTELEEIFDEFFTVCPDPAEVDTLLWRMFYHASLYDQQRNGVAAYLEDYGRMKESLSQLVRRLHKINALAG